MKVGEIEVRGAQLCKTGKAGAACFADVPARNIQRWADPQIKERACRLARPFRL
jgi:hypothetical protein